MGLEIERKYTVHENWRAAVKDCTSFQISQGYLSKDNERVVRVRIKDEIGILTIKGKGTVSRVEFEYEIPLADARQLLELCLPHPIEKTRYLVPFENHVFEVDEFHGLNQGLVIAEVELQLEDEKISLPSWIHEEVSHNPHYFNSYLSSRPFSEW